MDKNLKKVGLQNIDAAIYNLYIGSIMSKGNQQLPNRYKKKQKNKLKKPNGWNPRELDGNYLFFLIYFHFLIIAHNLKTEKFQTKKII